MKKPRKEHFQDVNVAKGAHRVLVDSLEEFGVMGERRESFVGGSADVLGSTTWTPESSFLE